MALTGVLTGFTGIVARTKGVKKAGTTAAVDMPASSSPSQSKILDSKGNPIQSTQSPQSTPTSPMTTPSVSTSGASTEVQREQTAKFDRMIMLLEGIEKNTGGRIAEDSKKIKEQSLFDKYGGLLGSIPKMIGVILGSIGLGKGIESYNKAKSEGKSTSEALMIGGKDATKSLLNLVASPFEKLLSFFDIDVVKMMGGKNFGDFLFDTVFPKIYKFVEDFANYIGELPKRILNSISNFVSNLGIPEFKLLGFTFGPYYPFRGKEIEAPKEENIMGPENTAIRREKKPETFVMPTPPRASTEDLSGQTAPIPPAEMIPTTPILKPSILGESVSIRKTTPEMSKEEAKNILASPKYRSITQQMNLRLKGRLANGEPIPSVDDLFEGFGLMDKNFDSFKNAAYAVYPEIIQKAYNYSKNGKFIDETIASADASSQWDLAGEAVNNALGMTPSIRSGTSALIPSEPMSGDSTYTKSSDLEAMKTNGVSSAPVIINAPSNTVNAPKDTNAIVPNNVRNSENTVSRYVDSLYGVNL